VYSYATKLPDELVSYPAQHLNEKDDEVIHRGFFPGLTFSSSKELTDNPGFVKEM
jgi:hypothetical protein